MFAFGKQQNGLFPGREEADKSRFSSSPDASRGWNWHLVTSKAFEAGCRGVTGPVPQPLNMRFVLSTNADRLILKQLRVNRFLFDFKPTRGSGWDFSYRYVG
jgi:hypothetical protein